MRCSTVTPGKFATFWRNPVSLLNSVDFPELGGPTMATICRRAGAAAGGGRVAVDAPWQSSIRPSTNGGSNASLSRALMRLPIRPREIPSDRLPARRARTSPSGREEIQAPSAGVRHPLANRCDQASRIRRASKRSNSGTRVSRRAKVCCHQLACIHQYDPIRNNFQGVSASSLQVAITFRPSAV